MQLSAQEIYVSATSNQLFKLNILDCSYELVTLIDAQVFDIAFHPNGKLYGIAGSGYFYEVNLTTGETKPVHHFHGQIFNSLTIGGDGTIYTTGKDGDIWTFHLSSEQEQLVGNMGFEATGDLAFLDGELYAAVSGSRIVQIDLNNPSNTVAIIDESVNINIFGIVSHAQSCSDISTYAISSTQPGFSDVYQVDVDNNSLTNICNLNLEVGGAASIYEFFASSPLVIQGIDEIIPICDENNGSLTLQAEGGVGVLEYSIDGINFQRSNVFENLPNGIYNVIVRDENFCTHSLEAVLQQDNPPQINTVLVNHITCENPIGSLVVDASGGSGILEYAIAGQAFQEANNFENLEAGAYTILLQDEVGCQTSKEIEVVYEAPPVIRDIIVKPSSCGEANGYIEVMVEGGTDVKFALNSTDFYNSNSFSNLASGTYEIQIQDAYNCTDNQVVAIAPSFALRLQILDNQPETCGESNGQFSLIAEGGTGQLSLYVNDLIESNLDFNNLTGGTYEIALQDEVGCELSNTVIIHQENCPIFIPNVFSPNDDGINDVFKINVHDGFRGVFHSMKIFDRYGNHLYEATNFDASAQVWDGTFRGKKLDTGLYVYIIEVEHENGERELLTGDVSIAH